MPDLQYYAGIDIGGTNIKFGIVDSNGDIVFKQQKPAMVEKGAKPLLHMITNIGENLLLRAAEDDLPVHWLGVGSPGTIDNITGTVLGASPNIPEWPGTELGSHLRDYLNLPVYVDNDANAMALAEMRFGAAKRFDSVICVTVGTGVGGAVILNREIWRGSTFSAGELGHIVVKYDGKKCKTGNDGCLEAYCSSDAMMERTAEKYKANPSDILKEIISDNVANLNIKRIFSAAKKNDPLALEVIEETARILGAGLAGVVNLLNPEAVVLGGGIVEGGAGFIEVVTEEIRRRAFQSATENLRVLKAELGNDAGFIGAGLLGEYKSKKA